MGINHLMKNNIGDNNGDSLNIIDQLFDVMRNPFNKLETEYHRLKYLENTNAYVKPKTLIFGERLKLVKTKQNRREVKSFPVTGQYIPIKDVIKIFLEKSNNFIIARNFLNSLKEEKQYLKHFCQGKLWLDIQKKFKNKTVFPLIMYFDDFNIDDVLGSHKGNNKIGAVYYTLPCFPVEFEQSMQQIFTAMLFLTNDREEFKNEIVFEQLIDDLKDLENEGIELKVGNAFERVYFVLGLFLGDNLGVHQIHDLVGGFNANFPCRYCKTNKNLFDYTFDEAKIVLRNKENYDDELKIVPSQEFTSIVHSINFSIFM